MGDFLISVLSTLVSAAAVAWGIYEFVVKRKEAEKKEERENHRRAMAQLKGEINKRLDDFDAMLGRNSAQFAQMREAFAVYRSKLDEFQRQFEKRSDKIDEEIDKLDNKIDAWGAVIRRDG